MNQGSLLSSYSHRPERNDVSVPLNFIGAPPYAGITCKQCGFDIRHRECTCADVLLSAALKAEDDGTITWDTEKRDWVAGTE